MTVEFVSSGRGNEKLCYENFMFIKEKTIENRVYWKCDCSRRFKCRARVITKDNQVYSQNNNHNHVVESAQIQAKKVMQKIKEDAEQTRDPPHLILAKAYVCLDSAVVAKLPSIENMKRTIRNTRIRKSVEPAIPMSREELLLPTDFTVTERGEKFLLYDSGPTNNRILIFSTGRNINLLARSRHWYAVGTFDLVPLPFEQIHVIHGLKNQVSVPLVYALLPNKSEKTYLTLLREIKKMLPASTTPPLTIMTDYEIGMINAIGCEFQQSLHRGCFFQFSQCIFRQIKNNDLQRAYQENAEIALNLKMLPALAFIPVDEVVSAFEYLCSQNMLLPEIQNIVDYFEDCWIGRPQLGGQRRQPNFAHSTWNCYKGVRNELPDAEPFLEGWHRRFQMQLSSEHPNIWNLMTALKQEQNLNEKQIEQIIMGQQSSICRRNYRGTAERLFRLVSSYGPLTNRSDYIREIAYNLTY